MRSHRLKEHALLLMNGQPFLNVSQLGWCASLGVSLSNRWLVISTYCKPKQHILHSVIVIYNKFHHLWSHPYKSRCIRCTNPRRQFSGLETEKLHWTLMDRVCSKTLLYASRALPPREAGHRLVLVRLHLGRQRQVHRWQA